VDGNVNQEILGLSRFATKHKAHGHAPADRNAPRIELHAPNRLTGATVLRCWVRINRSALHSRHRRLAADAWRAPDRVAGRKPVLSAWRVERPGTVPTARPPDQYAILARRRRRHLYCRPVDIFVSVTNYVRGRNAHNGHAHRIGTTWF
jgi:hypothetical protein